MAHWTLRLCLGVSRAFFVLRFFTSVDRVWNFLTTYSSVHSTKTWAIVLQGFRQLTCFLIKSRMVSLSSLPCHWVALPRVRLWWFFLSSWKPGLSCNYFTVSTLKPFDLNGSYLLTFLLPPSPFFDYFILNRTTSTYSMNFDMYLER